MNTHCSIKMNKTAIITGITGQDGSYLCEFLLEKNYRVVGLRRRSSSFNTGRIDHLYRDPHDPDARLFLHYGDITDTSSVYALIKKYQPDEIYNLAAQSHVGVSFETPEYTANCDALGPLRILRLLGLWGLLKKQKFIKLLLVSCMEAYTQNLKREHSFLSPKSLWCCKVICVLDYR